MLNNLHDQFLLSRHAIKAPDQFRESRIAGWTLRSHPSLSVAFVTVDGAQTGWLLGTVVPVGAEVLADGASFEISRSNVEADLAGLRGRWACVILDVDPVLYLDAGGSLSVVFDWDAQVAGSTTDLVLAATTSGHGNVPRRLAANQFYLAGLTHDDRVSRLLPNHLLDLLTWQSRRHWPNMPLRPMALDEVSGAIDTIVGEVRGVLEPVARAFGLILPLTAGRDSRMMLSAARHVLAQSEFVTFRYSDYRHLDHRIGSLIAERFSLKQLILDLPAASPSEHEDYLEAVGNDASSGKARDFRAAARALPKHRAMIVGFGGSLGRVNYHARSSRLDASEMIAESGVMADPRTVSAVERWISHAPQGEINALLGLFFSEMRQGAWAAPQFYGYAPFAATIDPFNSRAAVWEMLRLPHSYRRDQRMVRDFIKLAWPELLEIPISARPGWRGWIDRAHLGARHLAKRVLSRR